MVNFFLGNSLTPFFLSFRKCKTIHYCLQRVSFIVCLTTFSLLLIATLHIIHEQQYLSLHYCCCCFYLLACHFFIPSVAYDYIGTLLSETIWDSFKAGFFSYWKWNKAWKSPEFIKQLNNVMDTEPCLCTATPSPQWQNRGGGDCTQAKFILIFL